MSNKTISALIRLGHDLSEVEDASFDLWTWLPSYEVAKQHHGDYASEFRPDAADVMKEAVMYFGHLKFPHVEGDTSLSSGALTEEQREWFLRCPCGELHEEEPCEEGEDG